VEKEIDPLPNHAIGDEAIFLKIYAGLWISRSGGATWCWRDLDFRHSQIRVTAKALWKRGNPNRENDTIREVCRPPGEVELWTVRYEARQQMRRRTVLPSLLST
jgi:hypothetical protein